MTVGRGTGRFACVSERDAFSLRCQWRDSLEEFCRPESETCYTVELINGEQCSAHPQSAVGTVFVSFRIQLPTSSALVHFSVQLLSSYFTVHAAAERGPVRSYLTDTTLLGHEKH